MPFFSVVVIAYNQEKYIGQALDSVLNQDFKDIEVIVVNDCSTDGTANILKEYEQRDARIKVISHEENRGMYLSRKTGVLESTGDWVLLLDGDDEYAKGSLGDLKQELVSKPSDLLQLKVDVAEDGALPKEVIDGYKAGANIFTPDVDTLGPLKLISLESFGPSPNWSVVLQAYCGDLIRKAFAEMTPKRLDYAEDVYQSFVLRAKARSSSTSCTGPHYIYHMARGSSSRRLNLRNVNNRAAGIQTACDEIRKYAERFGDGEIRECAESYVKRIQMSFLNDVRFSPVEDLEELVDRIDGRMDSIYLSEALYRVARDKAYEAWAVKDEKVIFLDFANIIFGLAEKYEDNLSQKGAEYKQGALNHLNDISQLEKLQRPAEPITPGGPKVRMYVASHKKAQFPPASVYVPVQVNAAAVKERFLGFRYDDEGENISDRNARYCEMTVQYWAWKNEEADYYGFCHYRRYFNLSGNQYKENGWGEVIADYIDDDAIRKFGLTNEKLAEALQDCDVLCSPRNDVSAFPSPLSSIREHWHKAEHLLDEDLEILEEVVRELQPRYSAALEKVLSGSAISFCNMYVMRKDIFFDYCQWLFPLLERFEEKRDYSHYSKEALRTVGHLAERLFNVYMEHATRNTNIRVKTAQVVHFEHPEEICYSLAPAFNHDAIPVVFAGDDNYAPQLNVSVLSLAENSTPTTFYDVVIFSADLCDERFARIKESVADYPNISVRLFNVSSLIRRYKLRANAHISVETYYRFLIQDVLSCYDKVLYLDSDMVILDDVAKLYATDLGGKAIGAMHDVDFLGNLNIKGGNRVDYAKDTLGMDDPYNYFQAGVLLLNNKRLRELYSVKDWLTFAEQPLLYNDQDVLNMRLEHEVLYLDPHWNVLMDGGRIKAALRFAPADLFDEYLATRSNPRIIHYAGGLKPWNDPTCDFARYWWKYARCTTFYEESLVKADRVGSSGDKMWKKLKTAATSGMLGKFSGALLPIGSRRRETVKRVGKKVVGKISR